MAAAFYGEDDAIIAKYAKQAADAYKHIPAPERMRGVNSLLV
ncbi:hypothetical protein LJR267_010103 [Paraburkholderia hospita]|jgi:hypothetical protein